MASIDEMNLSMGQVSLEGFRTSRDKAKSWLIISSGRLYHSKVLYCTRKYLTTGHFLPIQRAWVLETGESTVDTVGTVRRLSGSHRGNLAGCLYFPLGCS